MRVLISWIGKSDLRAAAEPGDVAGDPGPLLRLLKSERGRFDRIHLLNDLEDARNQREGLPRLEEFQTWLTQHAELPENTIELHSVPNLQNSYERAYRTTREKLLEFRRGLAAGARVALLLSPGTPAAQAAMLLASQTLLPGAELFTTSREKGVERVQLPLTLIVDAFEAPLLLPEADDAAPRAEIAPAFRRIHGESRALRNCLRMAEIAARHEEPTLLFGESGTGKELFARAIHDAGPRRDGPYVPLHCAALSESLLEAELFGHEAGAFTGAEKARPGFLERAHRGTLFLDELGDMPPAVQVKLLRFLESGEYYRVGGTEPRHSDVRVIGATHRNLHQLIAEGRFREDIYYRLSAIEIPIPSLRDRGRDITLLAEKLLAEAANNAGRTLEFSEEALQLLQRRPWRGNVRELARGVKRLMMYTAGNVVTADDVTRILGEAPAEKAPLRRLDNDQLATHLAAALEELAVRSAEGWLDEWRSNPARPNLEDDIVAPLLLGRAMACCGEDRTRAGEALKGRYLDLTGERPAARAFRRYQEHFARRIDEQQLRRLRHGDD